MTRQKAIFEVWCWQHSNSGCFTQKLFDLIQKADPDNRKKLAGAFPELYEAWELWYLSPDPEQFFLHHGITRYGYDVGSASQ